MSGHYTVRSAYRLIYTKETGIQFNDLQFNSSFWKQFWKIKGIQPKVRHFGWRLLSGTLPLRTKLARFIPSIQQVCPFCLQEAETTIHLFFQCQRIQQTWYVLGFQSSIWRFNNVTSPFDIWKYIFLSTTSFYQRHLFFYVVWSIWLQRNECIFRNKALSEQSLIARSQALFNIYHSKDQRQMLNFKDLYWNKPAANSVTLNVDASLHNQIATAGVIV